MPSHPDRVRRNYQDVADAVPPLAMRADLLHWVTKETLGLLLNKLRLRAASDDPGCTRTDDREADDVTT